MPILVRAAKTTEQVTSTLLWGTPHSATNTYIAIARHPLQGRGCHCLVRILESGAFVREKYLPLLREERYGVDVVIGGHSHIYQRGHVVKTKQGEGEGIREYQRGHVAQKKEGEGDRREGKDEAKLHLLVVGGGGGELEDFERNHVETYKDVYEVTRAVHHFVTMQVCDMQCLLKVHAYDVDNRVIDSFQVVSNAPRCSRSQQ